MMLFLYSALLLLPFIVQQVTTNMLKDSNNTAFDEEMNSNDTLRVISKRYISSNPQTYEIDIPGKPYIYMYVKVASRGRFYYHLQYNSKKESINGFISDPDDFKRKPHLACDVDHYPYPCIMIEPISASYGHCDTCKYKAKMAVFTGISKGAEWEFDLDSYLNPEDVGDTSSAKQPVNC